MEKETCTFSYCARPEIIEHETDILLIGGGMANCGAAFEGARWATPKGVRITLVDKAAMDRSGAVAMGLSAINTYMGENDPANYVKYVKGDLMGIIREDLVYDVGRHVDDSVHLFEEWGLPVWKRADDGHTMDGAQPAKKLSEGGKPVRSGKWQIMINGESYKVIVAEAAKKALEFNRQGTGVAQNLFERVFIVKLLPDPKDANRVAAAIGFSVRENKVYIFKAKAMLLAAGGAVNCFRPRSVAEGQGRAWYPIWNAGSTYAMAAQMGAELVLMENRFVPARFKDGYGPVGAWFLFFKAKATNALGEDYCVTHFEATKAKYGSYCSDPHKLGTAIRNHMMMIDMKAGKGPIYMNTHHAMAELAKTMDAKQIKHLEAEAWEDFLDMCIGQAGVWAGYNIDPSKTPSEIMPTEPYLLGSHAGCAGIWVSGPDDLGAPKEWNWGYNRMSTVKGLFTAGDGVGASGHKFSSGSHAEGRIAAKAMVALCLDEPDYKPELSKSVDELAGEIYLPYEIYEKYKNYSTDPHTNPNYIRPKMLQARLQKIMDEYVGGVSTWYMTSKTMLEKGLEQLVLLKEDSLKMAAADLHELMRCWENYHRIWAGESHARHILFREDSRYPGYYYRGDFDLVDDTNWKCFTISKFNNSTQQWELSKRDYVQLIPD
ncbi:adenylyl-sulfate reductase subunit alpha [Candidatus Magnetobacterium casense]|uniref:Adenylyl-sulfate reductase subunit alpha n=1 Tax=Candidatus Magnetobacterium casense TaxID=1455061 RepID=A0ABS6RW39_9BACT|nr:adenylyl-sulfate reductase subunit alpha [Candidatus Magnetobacterium casensis]MBV6340845.1 adenylyl-sulfate reductase subunit alpha [Candidatus Magnetobacterium casensis]